jgi:hypothetical protein
VGPSSRIRAIFKISNQKPVLEAYGQFSRGVVRALAELSRTAKERGHPQSMGKLTG